MLPKFSTWWVFFSFFKLLTVKNLGYGISFTTFKPIQFKFAGTHKNPSPTTKLELMRFIGSVSSPFNFFERLHNNLKHLCDLSMDLDDFNFYKELETMYQQIVNSITKHVTLNLLNTKYHSILLQILLNWYRLQSVSDKNWQTKKTGCFFTQFLCFSGKWITTMFNSSRFHRNGLVIKTIRT